MTDILDEIKEDIKQEKNLKIWKKYGSIIIACCVVAVAATSVNVFLKNKKTAQNQSEGDKLFNSLQQSDLGDTQETIKSFNKIQDETSPSIAAIASFRKAYLFEKERNYEQAMQAYIELSKTINAPIELKDLAELKYLNLAVNLDKTDEVNDFENKLKRLSNEDGVWKYSAIQLAGFYAFSNDQNDKAKELFVKLTTDDKTPPSIRKNAENMVTILN